MAFANVLTKVYHVGAYIRLSKEDEKIGESESITNQRSLLLRYVKEQDLDLVDIYVDDGYSGTNFNRPEFIRMIKDIELGKINMVITKDMSRLGRDYIETGNYIEKWFPEHKVRYVALTDNIDTALDSTNNEIAPFKAIMNDFYAKDISKKIRTSLRTKQRDGKWVGGCPPFGYMKDPNDKNHLIPNEEEASIVRKIFELASLGLTTYAIKEYLINMNIPTPAMIRGTRGNKSDYTLNGIWNTKTIHGIITNRLYTGDMIQNRRNKVNYKIKKVIYLPESEWIIVENTHEALVSKEVFNDIQSKLHKSTKRTEKEIRLLDGLLFCFECKHRITICSPRKSDNKTYIACNYYRMNSKRHVCTSHGFNYDFLESGVIDIIRNICKKILDTEKLSNEILLKCKKNSNSEKIQDKIKNTKNELDKINETLDKMYLDYLDEKIDTEMYERISNNLKEKIKVKKCELQELNVTYEKIKNDNFTSKECMKAINEFINTKTPTREMIIKLINKIEIHQNKQIDIYFNFKELNLFLSN